MPHCLRSLLQLLTSQFDLRARARKPGGRPDQAIFTPSNIAQNIVESERAILITDDERQKYGNSRKRFAQSEDGHRHCLGLAMQGEESLMDRLMTRIGFRNRTYQSRCAKFLAEWEQWAEEILGRGPAVDNTWTLINRKYGEVCGIVGFGNFGVILLSHKTEPCNPHIDRYYALKIFRRRPHQREHVFQDGIVSEFSIASSLRHQNVVRPFELVPLCNGNFCECMEYCSGGDLHSLITASGRLMEAEADCFFKQLLRGICYIHEMGIAHRDLKPENLLLSSNGCLKISDFGSSECFRLAWEEHISMSTERRGSIPYISPEQYLLDEFDPRSVDIWAAAIVYVAMRTGRNMWKMANEKDECFRDYVEDRKIGRGCFSIEDICHVSFWAAPQMDVGVLTKPASHAVEKTSTVCSLLITESGLSRPNVS